MQTRTSRGCATRPTTDDMGVLELDIELPASAAEGLYELRVARGQERATARLQVRDFEVPTLAIDHTLGRFLTRDADELEFELSLALVTGEAVEQATLELSASARDGTALFERELELKGPGPHTIALSDEELASLKAGGKGLAKAPPFAFSPPGETGEPFAGETNATARSAVLPSRPCERGCLPACP